MSAPVLIDTRQTARGNGPPPPGFIRCRDAKCPGRREPWSGRFSRLAHYHPYTIAVEMTR